jgi:integrase
MDEQRRLIEQGIQIEQHDSIKQSAAEALNERSDRKHSREDALTTREFERMVDASYQIDDPERALEARAALYLTGRLGLRNGEATHLAEDWVDWADGSINIPEFWECTKGQHGDEICGNCRNRVRDNLKSNNLTKQEAIEAIVQVLDDDVVSAMSDQEILQRSIGLRDEVNKTYREMADQRWQPKTEEAARSVPFDFDVRIELCLERFFDEYNQWPRSSATLNRRINRLAEIADIEGNVYPHALRATSASVHASRDISIHSLMSVMGWSDPSTARVYILANDEQAAREIRSKHR